MQKTDTRFLSQDWIFALYCKAKIHSIWEELETWISIS